MNLLIIEDDGGSREILRRNLEARGFACHMTESPDEALRTMKERPVDLVLSDIHLPGCTGTKHIERFCSEAGGAPVIVMTGFPSLETCLDSFRFGAQAYMVKPFRVDELVELIHRAVEEGRLREELLGLKERVAELEQELRRLKAG